MSAITLTPRYGRDYRSRAEVEAAFNAGKDFTVADVSNAHSGQAANKEDLVRDPRITTARIRYSRLTKVVLIEVKS